MPDLDLEYHYFRRPTWARRDPEARAAVAAALCHIEIHADTFWRRDVIEAAMRIAPPDMTVFRIACDLQRLVLTANLGPTLRNLGDPVLRPSIGWLLGYKIYHCIHDASQTPVVLLSRREAVARLKEDGGRRILPIAPNRASAADLTATIGVAAGLVKDWIAAAESAAMDPSGVRHQDGRALLVDRAWRLPHVDVLCLLTLCRMLETELILTDNGRRFALRERSKLWYRRDMPRVPKWTVPV